MREIAVIIVLSMSMPFGYGQTQRIITYSQLADDIFINKKDTVRYENVHFVNDLPNQGKETFLSEYYTPPGPVTIKGGFKRYLELKKVKRDSLGYYHSNKRLIEIKDSRFDNDIRFCKVIFHGRLNLTNNDFPTQSDDYVGPYGQIFGGGFFIDSCILRSRFVFYSRKELPYRFFSKFNHSEFNGFSLELQKSTMEIKKSKFYIDFHAQIHNEGSRVKVDSSDFGPFDALIPDLGLFDMNNIGTIAIKNSNFNDSTSRFGFFNLNAKIITIYKNNFNMNTDVFCYESEVYIRDNAFLRKLAFDIMAISRFSDITIASLKQLNFGIREKSGYYDASTKEQIDDRETYKTYVRANKTLYDHFRDIGDINSADEVYVRIRNIENGKLEFAYQADPSFKNFFSLNLNRLLKFYTNYGTDPARAIVISVYVILVFGVFYFFFPSDWDVTSKSKLVGNFRDFITKNDEGYFRPFLKLILGFVVSIVNAVTLSLNAFTTLGFGNIPTHGLARYVCVVQGFIGWFLLSIFTVALINQAQF